MAEDFDGQISSRRKRASGRAARRLWPRFVWGVTKSAVPAVVVGFLGTSLPYFNDVPDEWIWGGVSLWALVGTVASLVAVRESYRIQMGISARATMRDIDSQYPEN